MWWKRAHGKFHKHGRNRKREIRERSIEGASGQDVPSSADRCSYSGLLCDHPCRKFDVVPPEGVYQACSKKRAAGTPHKTQV